MPRAIHQSELAKLDLLEIWHYIAEDSLAAADRLIQRIDKALATLARSPGMGRSRDDLSPLLRSFPVGNYLIFYKPAPGGITVVRD